MPGPEIRTTLSVFGLKSHATGTYIVTWGGGYHLLLPILFAQGSLVNEEHRAAQSRGWIKTSGQKLGFAYGILSNRTNPMEKVASGPQGTEATHFCTELKQVLALTPVFSSCAWRPTTSLVRPFYCPMSLCADITKSTFDSDRLPWLPTIRKSCLEPPVLAPSCAQDLSAPGCVSAVSSPNLQQLFAPLGTCRFFNELVYFIGNREGWVLRIINILVEEDSPKPQALIHYC